MVEDTFTLTTFYRFWKAYQDHIKGALAPLTAEQLGLRAAPHLRSIGENALHIIGTRVGWFIVFLAEDFGEEMGGYLKRNEIALRQEAPIPTAAELVQGLDLTWQCMRIVWPAGAPTICNKPSPISRTTAHKLTCRAPGWSGM